MTFTELLNELFEDLQTTNDNTSALDEVDFSNVTKEELDETMNYLKDIKDNPIMNLVLPADFIDNIMAEVQAKWDISHDAHEEKEGKSEVKETTIPEDVEKQIKTLVDEYVDLKVGGADNPIIKTLLPYAKTSYEDFAKFIFTHK